MKPLSLQRCIRQASNIPRGMWAVAAALPQHELPPKVQIRLVLIVGPAAKRDIVRPMLPTSSIRLLVHLRAQVSLRTNPANLPTFRAECWARSHHFPSIERSRRRPTFPSTPSTFLWRRIHNRTKTDHNLGSNVNPLATVISSANSH